jgi:hypothetical protein
VNAAALLALGRGCLGQHLDQPIPKSLTASELAGLDLVLQPSDDRRGGLRADVGHDQGLLELLPG